MSRSVSAVSLLGPDYEAGIAFYVGKLGFTLVEDTPLDDGKRWVLVSADDGAQTRLLLAKAADSAQQAAIGNQACGRVFLFMKTDDFDADQNAPPRPVSGSSRHRVTRPMARWRFSKIRSATNGT